MFGSQVIVSLFNAIRATRLSYLQKKHQTLRDADVSDLLTSRFRGSEPGRKFHGMCFLAQLIPVLTRHFLKEGYMEKTGPTVRHHSQHIF